MFGYQFKAKRLEQPKSSKNRSSDNNGDGGNDLQTLTQEADRQATIWLGSGMLPLVVGYTIYSLVKHEHVSWYSWLVTSASSGVYAFGFVLMPLAAFYSVLKSSEVCFLEALLEHF